jgi:hypothetical protein
MANQLSQALSLASRFGEAYRLAEPSVRRWFNQAVLEGVCCGSPREGTAAVARKSREPELHDAAGSG